MNAWRTAAFVLMLTVVARCPAADRMPWGVYVWSEDGPGETMTRADGEGRVVLGKQLTHQLRDPALLSLNNDNSLYRLTVDVDGIPDGPGSSPMAVVVAGVCVPVNSYWRKQGDNLVKVGGTLAGGAVVAKVADALRIRPQPREHPGHRLLVTLTSAEPGYRPREPVTLVMSIRNVGTKAVRFMDGGAQRGARNNQFGFTAYGGRTGAAVPDTGDPHHMGGLGSVQTLEPGEALTKTVDLSKWFTFADAGGYSITAMYRMELYDAAGDERIWDDVAVATCTVRVADKPTTKP